MSESVPRRPTLGDVASAAGVSIATASRVLHGGVASARAREVVGSTAERLGYVANAHARSLRRDRTMTVGVAFFSLKLPGALEMLESLSRLLDDSGYTVLIADTGGDVSRFDRILERFLERRVDALVCVNPHNIGSVLGRFVQDGIPAVAVISRGRGASRLPLLTPDLRSAADAAVGRLCELGHERCLVLLPGGEGGPFRAVWESLRSSTLSISAVNPFAREFQAESIVSSVADGDAPSAVVTTYPVALELLRRCRVAGIAVPRCVSIVAVSDDPGVAELLETPLSAIEVDLGALGAEVAAALLAWLRGEAPAKTTLLPVSSWVERSTTGRAARCGKS